MVMKSSLFRIILVVALVLPLQVAAFMPTTNNPRRSNAVPLVVLQSQSQSSQSSQSNTAPSAYLFPVLSQIHGKDWEGDCRYINAELQPAANLKLTGGIRYDLNGDVCTLTSFLAFPDGRTRQVEMRGKRGSPERPSMRLDSTTEEDGGGPIYMIVTELAPDTVLLNEVEKATGRIVMTSSLSIVNGGDELVQISHEVGDFKKKGDLPIEGHQVWRLKKSTRTVGNDKDEKRDENTYRGATGR